MKFYSIVVFSLLFGFFLLGCTQGPTGQAAVSTEKLLAPENLRASSSNGEIRLKWNPDFEAVSATIYRQSLGLKRKAIGSVQFASSGISENFSFIDSQISRGTKYSYCVTHSTGLVESDCSNDITITAR